MGLKAVATLVPGGGPPVGGSGIIGTVPKWDTTTTLNDSVITESGGRVGIGTTPTAAHKLDVAGKIGGGVFGDSYIEFQGSGATVLRANNTVNIGYMDSVSVTNTGNVGIGTPAPGCALDVVGVIKTSGYTVATLPAGAVGQRAYVTDALAPTYLGALVGGGAVYAPVFHNGTAWVSA